MAFSPELGGGPSWQAVSSLAPPSVRVRSRAQSISSDRPSTVAHSLMSPPITVSPEAAFIAASAASQIVTNDHDSHADTWLDQHGIEPSAETATVSPAALLLVNNFLDQLLFNFLSISKSTSIAALRPAVSEVLKPKLAKDAINQADEELREYLGGGDEELLDETKDDPPRDWDVELIWKRTRLRCMVYSSLGDMEEEDEDFHMEQEDLGCAEDSLGETVSPAVAIFLTSILEFMGEQALVVAGQAAFHRMRAKYDKEVKEGARSPAAEADRIIVEELDMERVALDRTLGRLWRAWKKKIRAPAIDNNLARAISRENARFSHLRQASMNAADALKAAALHEQPESEPQAQTQKQNVRSQDEVVSKKEIEPATVPLPLGEDDIAEILIPGLAKYADDEETGAGLIAPNPQQPLRPKSLMISPGTANADLPTPTLSQPNSPILTSRKRSNSLPTPAASPYRSAVDWISETASSETSQYATDAEAMSGEELALPKRPARESPISEGKLDAVEKQRKRRSNRLSVITGSAAVSAGGIAIAIASDHAGKRSAARAASQPESEDDGEIDDFTEEPQILTSSRVSISGRSSSPASSDHGGARPVSINTSLPVRSPSVHSVRMIEVQSPRSPMTRSRRSSVDAAGTHLRTSSSTPPIVEERRTAGETSSNRAVSYTMPKPIRHHTSESISEADEDRLESRSRLAPVVSTESASIQAPPQAIFGSVTRAKKQPQSPAQTQPPAASNTSAAGRTPTIAYSRPQPTPRVAVTNNVDPSQGTFFMDEHQELPSRPVHRQAPPPAVPDRSPSRHPQQQQQQQQSPVLSQYSPAAATSTSGRHPSPPETIREEPAAADRTPSRQLHTSGSSTSSSQKYKAVRASEETVSMRPEDVARNFEELIQSDETIQYTLTPESMRDLDAARSAEGASPAVQSKGRKSEDTRQANGERSRSSSVVRPRRSTSVSRAQGIAAHSPPPPPPPPPQVIEQPNGKLIGSIPRAPPNMQPSSRAGGPQAREARIPRESLADFAAFIRETGPAAEVAPPVSANMGRRSSAVSSVQNGSGSILAGNRSVEFSRPSTNNSARTRLTARDPTMDRDDNSDLLDFIRKGPPSAGAVNRNLRIMASFRGNMDPRVVDPSLPNRDSAASATITERSVPSSVNSQSALLRKERPRALQTNGTFDNDDDEGMVMPKRTQRRVRDPYAIDFSDDEEEEDTIEDMVRPPQRKPPREESLMDFLNSVPPPPETAPIPFTQNRPAPKKKASAPSLMSRFSRSATLSHLTSPSIPRVSDSRSLSSRAGTVASTRGFVPIEVHIPNERMETGTNSSRAPTRGSMSTTNGAGTNGRVQMRRFETRDARVSPSNRTDDLAEFLRSSDPSPQMTTPSRLGGQSYGQQDEASSGFSRVFNRRKKSTPAH